MSDTAVRVLESAEYPLWDELVDGSPQGTVFHTSTWVATMAKLFRRTPRIYGCWSDGVLTGGCSLYLHSFHDLYTTASSVSPMTPYGGMVIARDVPGRAMLGETGQHAVIDALAGAIEAEHFAQVRLRQPPGFDDIRPLLWRGWETGVGYTYHVTPGAVTISRNGRRNIRKAEQQGVTVRRSDDIDGYVRLFEETFSRQGMQAPVGGDTLREAYACLRAHDRAEMWAAFTDDGAMAGADIYVRDPRRVYRWSAVSDPELRKLGGAYLLLQTAFSVFGERGYETVDIMTANIAHLAEFSRNFFPALVPHYEIRKTSLRKKIAGFFLREG